MIKKILVDADMLVALAKCDDSNHKRAVKCFQLNRSASLFVSPFCVAEAATVLSYKVSHQAACQFLQNIRQRSIEEITLSSEVQHLSDHIFLQQRSKGISWPDCCNVAIMQICKMDAIASFDKFYSALGIKML